VRRPGTTPELSSGAVYGTLVSLAVVAGLSEDPAASAGEIDIALLITAVSFALAHGYTELLAVRVNEPDESWREHLRAAARHQWALLESAAIPAACLLLGVVGLLSRNAAIWLAIAVELVELFGWGTALGRGHGQSFVRAVAGGVGALLVGVAIAALKAYIH